ncbi:MAG: DUF427 domain-containing protein [Pseudomonadales bacterium]|nr:DUF427 domain-containing protein [Pseudomonadales bacterium]
MIASWNGQILAQSDDVIIVENNAYFPKNSLEMAFFETSNTTSVCPWKGDANYFSVTVNGEKNEDCAWYYVSPKEAAMEIKNHVAFWKGVSVE